MYGVYISFLAIDARIETACEVAYPVIVSFYEFIIKFVEVLKRL